MERKIPFTTLQDINKKSEGKPIVLFGSGNIAEKTARILIGKRIVAVIDNASNLWGQVDLDVEIVSPDYLNSDKGKNSFVIICTTSFVTATLRLIHSFIANSCTTSKEERNNSATHFSPSTIKTPSFSRFFFSCNDIIYLI